MTSDDEVGRTSGDFLTALRSIADRLLALLSGTGSPVPNDVSNELLRAAAAAQANSASLARVADSNAELALLDARQLDGLLVRLPQEADLVPVVIAVAGRVVGHVGQLLVAGATETPSPNDRPAFHVEPDDKAIDALAEHYGDDAQRERSGARLCGTLATGAFSVAVGAAAWVVNEANANLISTRQTKAGQTTIHQTSNWLSAFGPLLICIAALLIGLLLIHAVSSRLRAAREYTRLQRGLQGLGAYLAPLPAPARHLLRATMTQTLFPRLLDDDDPMRQPSWPATETLASAVYDYGPEPAAESPPST